MKKFYKYFLFKMASYSGIISFYLFNMFLVRFHLKDFNNLLKIYQKIGKCTIISRIFFSRIFVDTMNLTLFFI